MTRAWVGAPLQSAREDAFVAIRTAWHSSGIEARPGEDWDLSWLSVSPDARM